MNHILETDKHETLELGTDGYRVVLRLKTKTKEQVVFLKPSQARILGGALVGIGNKLVGEITGIAGSISGREI